MTFPRFKYFQFTMCKQKGKSGSSNVNMKHREFFNWRIKYLSFYLNIMQKICLCIYFI